MASEVTTSGAAGVEPAASSPVDPILDVDGVTIQYKTKEHLITATYRVSFQVFPADRFVILGPSGCGKSTLLKSVAGYLHPVEGEMRLKGNVVRDPGPDRVMVFQEFDQARGLLGVQRLGHDALSGALFNVFAIGFKHSYYPHQSVPLMAER